MRLHLAQRLSRGMFLEHVQLEARPRCLLQLCRETKEKVTMEATAEVDASGVLSFLDRSEKFVPMANAVALNRTAEWGTKFGRDRAVDVFHVREPAALGFAFPRSIPGKERATPSRQEVVIEPSRSGKLYGPYEEGLPHVPDRLGRWPAVPSSGFRGLRRTPMTKIPRQLYPANLGLQPKRDASGSTYYALGKGSKKKKLTPYRTTEGGQRVKEGREGTYEIEARSGNRLIFQRLQGPKAGSRLLWVLTPSVKRPKQLEYFDSIERAAKEKYPSEMAAAFTHYQGIEERRAATHSVRSWSTT